MFVFICLRQDCLLVGQEIFTKWTVCLTIPSEGNFSPRVNMSEERRGARAHVCAYWFWWSFGSSLGIVSFAKMTTKKKSVGSRRRQLEHVRLRSRVRAAASAVSLLTVVIVSINMLIVVVVVVSVFVRLLHQFRILHVHGLIVLILIWVLLGEMSTRF